MRMLPVPRSTEASVFVSQTGAAPQENHVREEQSMIERRAAAAERTVIGAPNPRKSTVTLTPTTAPMSTACRATAAADRGCPHQSRG